MRYWTRWVHIKYEWKRKRESANILIAAILPRKVCYWAAIRLGVHATTGEYGNQVVPDLGFMEALDRWDYKR